MEVASLEVSASQCNDPNEMPQLEKPRAVSVSLNGRDRDLRESREAEHRRAWRHGVVGTTRPETREPTSRALIISREGESDW